MIDTGPRGSQGPAEPDVTGPMDFPHRASPHLPPRVPGVREAENATPERLSIVLLCAIFLITLFLPPVPVYVGLTSSYSVGMTAAAAACFLIAATAWAVLARRARQSPLDIGARGLVFIVIVLGVVGSHGIVADHVEKIDMNRFLASFIPLVFLLAGGLAVAWAFRGASASQLHTVTWVSFWALLIILALRLTGLQPRAAAFAHSTFPFTETSHFALAFGPILLYRCTSAPRSHRTFWIIFASCLAILIKSATLVVFVCFAAFLCRRLAFMGTLGLTLLVSGAVSHLTYFTSRTDISAHSSSVSALVYLQGWEFLYHSIAKTFGWGLGFQQLGVHPMNLPVSHLIRAMTNGENLNTQDGSFLLSKLGSEFGIFGIILGVAFARLCLRCARSLRESFFLPNNAFAQCIIVAFGVNMFIRSTGYFYGGSLLFLGALLSFSIQRQSSSIATPALTSSPASSSEHGS